MRDQVLQTRDALITHLAHNSDSPGNIGES